MAHSIHFTLGIGGTEVLGSSVIRTISGLVLNVWQQNPWHWGWDRPRELQVQSQPWHVTDRVAVALV